MQQEDQALMIQNGNFLAEIDQGLDTSTKVDRVSVKNGQLEPKEIRIWLFQIDTMSTKVRNILFSTRIS